VTEKHNDHASGEATADITSALRANFFEPDAPTTARAQGAVSGIDELPSGPALLVVKRGPNAGSRFVLDQPISPPADTPTAISSAMTSPSVAGTPSSGARTANSRSSTSAASTAPMSTVSRCNRQSWPTATKSR